MFDAAGALLFVMQQASTCGDANGAGGTSAEYSCPVGYRKQTGVESYVIEGLSPNQQLAACCELVSAPTCVQNCFLKSYIVLHAIF
jgi:hypothetical protein